MKLKGISIWEQHIEKFVLGAVVLIALFFGAMQFFGRNTVEIDGTPFRASEVDAKLQEKAEDVRSRLAEGAEQSVDPPASPRVYGWFHEAVGGSTVPGDGHRVTLHQYNSFLGAGVAVDPDQWFVEPQLAGTAMPFVGQYADALDPDVVQDLPQELRDRITFGTAGTYDLSWTTPAALLDLKAIRAQLAATDPSNERLPIPPIWSGSGLHIMDVVLERQEQGDDGQWGETTVVEVLPTMITIRERLTEELPIPQKDGLLAWLKEPPGANQAAIIQPEFYSTKSSSWSEPEVQTEVVNNPAMAGIIDLQRRIGTLEHLYEQKMARLTEAGGPLEDEKDSRDDDDDRGNTGGGGGGGGGQLGGGGGGSGLDPGGDGEGGNTADEQQRNTRIRLTREVRRLETKLTRLREQLDEAAKLAGIELNPTDEERRLPDLDRDDSVLVWGHDVMVTPGRAYRYRVIVKVYNPFFGRANHLVPSQQHLALKPTMDVEPSPWSEPVVVKPHTRFFVTTAQPEEGPLGMGQTRIEVYRLYDGQWHQRELTLQPGDPIGQVETTRIGDGEPIDVDYRTNAYVQDVLRTTEADGGDGGKVIIVLPDGSTITRVPEADMSDTERLELATHAGTA